MMVKVGDRVQIDETCSNYYGRCGMVIGDDFCATFPYEVEFDDSDTCIFNGKDLIVLSTEEETSMKFKVGDKVKVKDSWFGNDGQVGVVVRTDNYEPYNYGVKFDVEGDNERYREYFRGDSLELIEEETSMKFKVGDKVKVLNTEFGNKGKIGIIENISGTTMIYFVKLDGGCQWSNASDLELVTEEETSMKFKVGDKVKVSNSWDGHNGEVGEINGYNNGYEFDYCVTFEGEYEESFRETELELVSEKQTFTKSDLKTGMGVVLRDGSKGHVLKGTGQTDIIKDIEKSQWIKLDDYAEDLTCVGYSNLDVVIAYKTKWENKFLTDGMFEQDIVFKREKPKPEPTKMTMKEINEHFGKAIEIIE